MSRPSLLSRLTGLVVVATTIVGASSAGAVAASPTTGSGGPDRAPFVVTLRPGVDPEATAREWQDRGVVVDDVFRHAVSGFAAQMGPELADELRRDDRIVRVEQDAPVRASLTQAGATWGLDRVDQRSWPLDASYNYDHTGTGVTVYVIDTGVRASHVDFGGRVVAGFSAINDGNGTNDCNGHGTHVAGTIAGASYGAAKAVTVVPVRVLDCNGSGTMSGVIAGVEWVTAHHAAGVPAAAVMSLGGAANLALDTSVRNSISDGITYAVAAGNENVDACTKSPARVGEALTVAATTSMDARASYSNWGTCVDLFAPGSGVKSAYHTSDTATATMSGTSMAAPHVAGIAALYLTANAAATPATVGSAIVGGATANVVSDPAGSPNRLAYSRLVPVVAASVPVAPGAPTAAGARRGVTLAWRAPADGGSPISGYNVRIRRASDGLIIKTAKVSGSTLTTTVTGLSAGTTYYATVQAVNGVGSSPWSPRSNNATAAA